MIAAEIQSGRLEAVFAEALHAPLDEDSRATRAFAHLYALGPEMAEIIATSALEHLHFGLPLPLFGSAMTDAAWWAERATSPERDAYCVACFQHMPPRRQAQFLDFVQDKVAA